MQGLFIRIIVFLIQIHLHPEKKSRINYCSGALILWISKYLQIIIQYRRKTRLDEQRPMNGSTSTRVCFGVCRVEDVYEIGHELGKGAFSVVKHGRHRQTGQNVRRADKRVGDKLSEASWTIVTRKGRKTTRACRPCVTDIFSRLFLHNVKHCIGTNAGA